MEIWEHVALETTKAMVQKVQNGEASNQNGKRYYKPVSSKDILAVFFLQTVFRGRANLTTISSQFNVLPPELTKWPFNEKRYKAIISSLSCDFEELSTILHRCWCDVINPSHDFAIDEAIFAYHSRVDVSSPQRYIPRKPHPNGLLTYYAGFNTCHGPFIFDLEPDYQNPSLNARLAVQKMVQRWKCKDVTPHVTLDAGFSGEEGIEIVKDLNCFTTASFNKAHKSWLFNLLKLYALNGRCLSVKNDLGIWSIHKNGEGEHFLVTNAFCEAETETLNQSPAFSADQVKTFSKIGMRGLAAIANGLGISLEGDELSMAKAIVKHVSPNSLSTEVETFNNPINNQASSCPTQELLKKSIKELQSMAKDLKIKSTGRKDELVQALISAYQIKADKLALTKQQLRKSGTINAIQHDHYRRTFNAIDLHDRHWNLLQNHHTINSWKAKFVLSLLQSGLVNAFVIQKHFENISLLEFAQKVASAGLIDQ